jgi:multidrug resistance efflux pump
MIAFLTILYAAIAWLIFGKFKLLPFDLKNKIATAVIGLLFVCGILIAVNFLHPMTLDARVFQHVVEISTRLPQPGRVVDVPVEPNKPVKTGEVLFKVDPRPFQYEVDRLQAALAAAELSTPQLEAALDASKANVERLEAERQLAVLTQNRNLEVRRVNPGAVTQQTLDQDKAHVDAATGALHAEEANVKRATLAVQSSANDVAQLKAQLASAQLNLDEATVKAPTDGYVTNLILRPGFVVAPGQSVMSFVCAPEGVVVATLAQEYLGNIEVGDDAEVALDPYPGKMLRGKVEAILLATGEGTESLTGELPLTSPKVAHARIPVKIRLSEEDQQAYRLPAGASGAAAIYTKHGSSWAMVRKIMIRWYTWLNYVKLSV